MKSLLSTIQIYQNNILFTINNIKYLKCTKFGVYINILRIAKRVPVEHPQFAGENN